ncbi:hypothetical protein DPMN_007638 [Dreissena polymorpha]|uniref:Uncharacterized protein n=1 Tax=Dreissena polymorpha TaxID=45954 RepID=A0A9D4RYJ2_DREPO|nr:hypothetical protein DPMN_007638 [Dreissena polymorpha]
MRCSVLNRDQYGYLAKTATLTLVCHGKDYSAIIDSLVQPPDILQLKTAVDYILLIPQYGGFKSQEGDLFF